MQAILRRELTPARLLSLYPPALRHPNKQIVFDLACSPESVHSGTIELTRWAAAPLPTSCALAPTEIVGVPDVYDYGDAPGVWHATASS